VLRIGLTGGIACGKSEVARRFAAAGFATLDLDRLAHEVMAPGRPAHTDVRAAFGPGILAPDGSIDRRALGALVFRDPAARERLNALVHPRVREEEVLRAQALASRPDAVLVTDAALLVEAGMHLRFDRLVVVHCPPELQVARLRERDALSEEDARARVAAQMPVDAKVRFAHFAVDSSGTLSDTHRAADALVLSLRELAAHRPQPARVSRARAKGALAHGWSPGPRGLRVEDLAAHLVSHGGLELALLARTIDPPVSGPWYVPGLAPPPALVAQRSEPEAAALTVPLVLFERARHGPDPEKLAAGAHSLAWLTDPHPERIASAVLMALVLEEIAASEGIPPDLESRAVVLGTVAARWGRAEAGTTVMSAVRAAVRHPRDPAAARGALAKARVESGLAGAMVGLATGIQEEAANVWEPFLRLLESG